MRVLLATTGLLLCCAGCFPDPCGDDEAQAARARQAELLAAALQPSADPDAGLAALGDWSALPHLGDNRYEQFSSYNRHPGAAPAGGEDFNNFLAHAGAGLPLLLGHVDGPDPDGHRSDGYLLAAVDDGPGYVSRMSFTRFSVADLFRGAGFFASPDLGRFSGEVLRICVDDLAQPAFEIPLADMGAAAPFAEPLAGFGASSVTSYVPISFAQSLRVRLDGLCPLNGYFYHVDVQHTAEPTRPFSARLAEDADYAVAAELLARFGHDPSPDASRLVDDQSFALPADSWTDILGHEGSGTVTLLRFALAPSFQAALPDLRLQIAFDGTDPSIDVPLDVFFGCREQIAPFSTLAMQVACDAGVLDAACYLPMPFLEQVQIRLQNAGPRAATVQASVNVVSTVPREPWGHLHTTFNAVSGPQAAGAQFDVANLAGRGRYVGTFLFAAGTGDPRPGQLRAALNILEGNETGVIDGEVRLRGTGTEDYYNGGFYFAAGPQSHPFSAVNFVHGGFEEPGVVSCCRWHVLSDAIDFQRSFVLSFQYAADNPALVVRYATVAYYYLER
jgi:hypothetical protein